MSSLRIVRANSSVSSFLARSNNASSLSRTFGANSGLFMREASCSACPGLISPAWSASRVLGSFARPSAVLVAFLASRADMPPESRSRPAASPRRRASSATTDDRRASTAASRRARATISLSNAVMSIPDTGVVAVSPPQRQRLCVVMWFTSRRCVMTTPTLDEHTFVGQVVCWDSSPGWFRSSSRSSSRSFMVST